MHIQNLVVSGPKFSGGITVDTLAFRFWISPELTSDHVAKFRGDRPTEFGDLAMKKEERKKEHQE